MTNTPLANRSEPLHLLVLNNSSIFQQLQLEEALLRADKRNWCLINRGSPPAIVMGISGKSESLVDQRKLQQNPIPLVRRFSGGGTVVVDQQTLFVSWICNADHSGVNCSIEKIHQWAEKKYQLAWPSINMHLRENDYVIGERKFGGNAQYLCKQRWLHHSSLLWDYHPQNMEYLLMPSKTPKYREERSHLDFLCRISDYYDSRTKLETDFLKALHHQFAVLEMELADVMAVTLQPHRKATQIIE